MREYDRRRGGELQFGGDEIQGRETEYLGIRPTWSGRNGQLRYLSAGRGENGKGEKGYVSAFGIMTLSECHWLDL